MSVVLGSFLILAAVAALAQQPIITSGAEALPDAPSSVVNEKASSEPAISLPNSSKRFLNLAAPAAVSPLIFTGGSNQSTTAGGPDAQSGGLSTIAWNCASTSTKKADGRGWFSSLLNIATRNQHYCALGEGGIWRRGTYAMSQAFAAHRNDGASSFNASQFSASGAVPNFASGYAAYPAYANQYDAGQRMATRYATALGRDTLKNMFREFWPDISTHVVKHR
jgi:hypothetical protein